MSCPPAFHCLSNSCITVRDNAVQCSAVIGPVRKLMHPLSYCCLPSRCIGCTAGASLTEHCTVCTVCSAHCTLHTAHSTAHCTLHTVHCTLRTAYCTLLTAHCTLHTAQCTVHTAHCTLHTAHCTLHTALAYWLTARCRTAGYGLRAVGANLGFTLGLGW
jgi:hypothetical protein